MVAQMFETIGDALTAFMQVLKEGFDGIIGLVWNATDTTLTPLGVILLIGLGVGVCYFVLSFVIRAIRNVGKAN